MFVTLIRPTNSTVESKFNVASQSGQQNDGRLHLFDEQYFRFYAESMQPSKQKQGDFGNHTCPH
ncbi:hypothetical protein V7S43_017239 [Phytophthora oleae]|uniref:Uncharacterized protein n=1 Tax=Phytophthora oleae TaxID=2107226 RepID=A0ABD3EU46_9STRA